MITRFEKIKGVKNDDLGDGFDEGKFILVDFEMCRLEVGDTISVEWDNPENGDSLEQPLKVAKVEYHIDVDTRNFVQYVTLK